MYGDNNFSSIFYDAGLMVNKRVKLRYKSVGIADITRHAEVRHHVGVEMSTHRKPMCQTHAILFLEASGDQQYSFWVRPSWACVAGNTEVVNNSSLNLKWTPDFIMSF